ncbi:hypothetical protein BPLS_P5984 [Bathymodiolus platifrons methanotrophic gill symbiont]|uniref:DUF1566 domain-containing protein n=1 Tax=Bathymodiolus platifrons methanotrophic gill symbiont TaxID=113268 RepID=UPI001B6331C9|nr:DUF1566 domain-containing protein [Bathymodiolus platifrons methanotrophic gill symbiont]GFO75068.1 hypothetical protein BPLS_P2072 [Bathymodiolus platifrons methanotrophic gill symbiont]GFO77506.1 hypothetical protein BPLS_P5984 [Bathymodiolus platifrons methanotrophic gill symbiont]
MKKLILAVMMMVSIQASADYSNEGQTPWGSYQTKCGLKDSVSATVVSEYSTWWIGSEAEKTALDECSVVIRVHKRTFSGFVFGWDQDNEFISEMTIFLLQSYGSVTFIPLTQKLKPIDPKSSDIITYKIGDIGPAGGFVFYVTDAGLHGIEAAPKDQVSSEWGCHRINVSGGNGADGLAIGTGEENTETIISNQCKSEDGGDIAAKAASDYAHGGFGDWYLPSQDALKLMFENLKTVGLGGFSNENYWSSSEYSHGNLALAWSQNFNYGDQHGYGKSRKLKVRAIRDF